MTIDTPKRKKASWIAAFADLRPAALITLLTCTMLLALPGRSQSLVWSNTLADARTAALRDGKMILLVAGRPDCGSCDFMELTVCESATVRPIIDEVYVPWYSNIDFYQDFMPYESGLDQGYTLPLICMIDPRTTNAWLRRLEGPFTVNSFASHLRTAATLYPPQPANLAAGQVLHDSKYLVVGHIWTNPQPSTVFYRVNAGTSTANPFTAASGTTDWTAPLAPYIVAGTPAQYTFEVYARFGNGTNSGTNRVVFSYSRAVTPVAALISAVQVSNGVVSLTLTNLTVGATHIVERSLDIGQADGWSPLTNFVASQSTAAFSEPLDDSSARVFYRVSSQP